MAQLQLLQQKLAPRDAIFTPDWCAKDMIDFFKPTGKILEPCMGDGAFLRYLPEGTPWCEIDKGRDFFAWNEQVDWIVTNPPYSIFNEFLFHGFSVCENIVYLIALSKFFTAYGLLTEVKKRGWIKHARIYGTGSKLKFPNGNAYAAVYFKRGWSGDTSWSWYEHEAHLTKPAPDAWESAPLNHLSTPEVDSDLGKVPTPTKRR